MGAEFGERLARLEDQLRVACRTAGRRREDVKLMAVSKTHPAEMLADAFAAGLRLFGENRVQEFQEKSAKLGIPVQRGELVDGNAASVHLIGHLQSNKTVKAAELFSAVDTLDSLKLARRLNDAAAAHSRRLPVLLEVKMSTEESKTGLTPGTPEFVELLEQLPDLKHLEVRGMMAVAPLDENPETARACFRGLRQFRDQVAAQYPRIDFSELSMGMSGDFAIAIEEGSTLIRVGKALFGARPKVV